MKKGVQFKKLFVVGDKEEQEKEIEIHYLKGLVPRLACIHPVSNPDMVGFK